MNDAKQMIWHKAYERALKTITSLRNHCDFKYEKDSKNADTVRILNAVRPNSRVYVPGVGITRDPVSSTSQDLTIDYFTYFNVGLDDVIKAQSVPGALEASAAEGALTLSDDGNKYVAKKIKDAYENSEISGITAFTATKANAIEKTEDALEILYGNNVKTSEKLWYEVCPKLHKFIRPNLIEVLTDNVEMAKKGIVGSYGNAFITIENLLPKGGETAYTATSDTKVDLAKTYFTRSGSEGAYTYTKVTSPAEASLNTYYEATTFGTTYNIIRTSHAVAFIEQIKKTKAYEVQDGFEDAVKGLYGCGAKVVRPDEIVIVPTNN